MGAGASVPRRTSHASRVPLSSINRANNGRRTIVAPSVVGIALGAISGADRAIMVKTKAVTARRATVVTRASADAATLVLTTAAVAVAAVDACNVAVGEAVSVSGWRGASMWPSASKNADMRGSLLSCLAT